MNTLKFGNSEWYGTEGNILAYSDTSNNYKPLPFTFSRGSIATRVNQQGLIETVQPNDARVDYLNNANGALKLEPTRTNLITYSEAFDNSYWTKSGASVTSGFVSPDGTNNAFKLVEDTSTGIHQLTRSITNTVANQYSISVFVKENTRNWIRLSSGDGGYVFFNISDNTIGIQTNAVGVIEDIGNGWKRCKITFTAAGTNGSATLRIAESDGVVSYVGQNKSVYVYAMQYEQGSYATSYIPTQGTAQTRLADLCVKSGNDQVINSTEGVLYLNTATLVNTQTTDNSITLTDGGNNKIIFRYRNVNAFNVKVFVNGIAQAETTPTLTNATEFNKIAIKWKLNDYKIYVNGINVFTDNNALVFPINSINTLDFADGTSTPLFGKVMEVKLYDIALSDSELAALTQV